MNCEIRQVGAAQVKLIIQQMVSLQQQHQLRETRQCLPSKLFNPYTKIENFSTEMATYQLIPLKRSQFFKTT